MIYLTIITLDFNSIYLFLSFICDISLFIFKSQKLEALNDFMRNKVCHVANPLSYAVTILFWTLALLGGMGDIIISKRIFIFNVHIHLLISILLIVDIFIAEHEKHTFSFLTLIIIFIYMILYEIFCTTLTFKFDNPPYPFLKAIKSAPLLLFFYALFGIAFFLCYLLHILVFKIKFKYVIKENYSSNNDDDQKIKELKD